MATGKMRRDGADRDFAAPGTVPAPAAGSGGDVRGRGAGVGVRQRERGRTGGPQRRAGDGLLHEPAGGRRRPGALQAGGGRLQRPGRPGADRAAGGRGRGGRGAAEAGHHGGGGYGAGPVLDALLHQPGPGQGAHPGRPLRLHAPRPGLQAGGVLRDVAQGLRVGGSSVRRLAVGHHHRAAGQPLPVRQERRRPAGRGLDVGRLPQGGAAAQPGRGERADLGRGRLHGQLPHRQGLAGGG